MMAEQANANRQRAVEAAAAIERLQFKDFGASFLPGELSFETATALGGALACGGLPGCGELSDVGVLLDSDAEWWEKTLAGTSLGANAICPSCPNVGPVILATKTLGRTGERAAKSATQVVRTTRTGEKAVRITRADGSVLDISPQRVKEYVPNTHPNAPPGTLDRVRFPDAQPGSKGLKRDPTPEELELLRKLP